MVSKNVIFAEKNICLKLNLSHFLKKNQSCIIQQSSFFLFFDPKYPIIAEISKLAFPHSSYYLRSSLIQIKMDTPRPVGRPRAFNSPEELWDAFIKYKEDTKANPILVHDFVGKDGTEIYRRKEVPLTIEGFKCFLFESSEYKFFDIDNYLDGTHKEFIGISTRIKEAIRRDQIKGGMAGIYNPSLTARINGLVDKVEKTVIQEQPLFGDEEK